MSPPCHRVARAGVVRREVGGQRFALALRLDSPGEGVESDAALLVARPAATARHAARGGFLVADDEHVVRPPLLRFLHPVAQIPGLLVEVHAEALGTEPGGDTARVRERRLADRDDRDLLPRQPEREVARVVLDETADEALEAP